MFGLGDRVRVDFHHRSVRGWVVDDVAPSDELKTIKKWLGFGPPPRPAGAAQVGERALVRHVVALPARRRRARGSSRHCRWRRPRPALSVPVPGSTFGTRRDPTRPDDRSTGAHPRRLRRDARARGVAPRPRPDRRLGESTARAPRTAGCPVALERRMGARPRGLARRRGRSRNGARARAEGRRSGHHRRRRRVVSLECGADVGRDERAARALPP